MSRKVANVLFVPIEVSGRHRLFGRLISLVNNGSYVVFIWQLLAKLDEGCTLAAFVLGGFGDGGDVGVGFEEVADAAAEDACSMAVDDADARQACEEGTVEVFLELSGGFVDGAADEVDLHAHVIGIGAGDSDVDASLFAGVGERVGAAFPRP